MPPKKRPKATTAADSGRPDEEEPGTRLTSRIDQVYQLEPANVKEEAIKKHTR